MEILLLWIFESNILKRDERRRLKEQTTVSIFHFWSTLAMISQSDKKSKKVNVHLAQGSFSSHRSLVSRAISASAIPSSVNSTELSLSSTL